MFVTNKKKLQINDLQLFVGTTRFELATPCTPCKCATGLRYVPNFIRWGAKVGKNPLIPCNTS